MWLLTGPIQRLDEYYRRWRKSFQFILGPAGIKRLLPLLESEAASLCQKFLDGSGADNSSNNYEQNLRHWALAVPLIATTGELLSDMPADYADKLCHSQEELLGVLLPGAAPPVDIFPVLKYFPEFLAQWKSKARYARKLMCEDADNYLVGAKKTYAQIEKDPESVDFDSLLPKIMKEQAANNGLDKDTKFTETELAYMSQAAVGAAVDTTLATFKNLMVAFAAFPETLVKAQKELDRVAGGEPLRGERIGELVYLKACVSEVSQ